VQLSTDALSAYTDAVERAFGAEVDYGSIVKTFGQAELEEQRRYSPPKITGIRRIPVQGQPHIDLISTSLVEKQNHTLRTALPQINAIDECFFQETGKLQSGGRASLRLLQFRKIQHSDSLHARDGRWRHKHVLDSSRSRGND
jgi:hypothetical protein